MSAPKISWEEENLVMFQRACRFDVASNMIPDLDAIVLVPNEQLNLDTNPPVIPGQEVLQLLLLLLVSTLMCRRKSAT